MLLAHTLEPLLVGHSLMVYPRRALLGQDNDERVS